MDSLQSLQEKLRNNMGVHFLLGIITESYPNEEPLSYFIERIDQLTAYLSLIA